MAKTEVVAKATGAATRNAAKAAPKKRVAAPAKAAAKTAPAKAKAAKAKTAAKVAPKATAKTAASAVPKSVPELQPNHIDETIGNLNAAIKEFQRFKKIAGKNPAAAAISRDVIIHALTSLSNSVVLV